MDGVKIAVRAQNRFDVLMQASTVRVRFCMCLSYCSRISVASSWRQIPKRNQQENCHRGNAADSFASKSIRVSKMMLEIWRKIKTVNSVFGCHFSKLIRLGQKVTIWSLVGMKGIEKTFSAFLDMED
jgi:hypothetical protein